MLCCILRLVFQTPLQPCKFVHCSTTVMTCSSDGWGIFGYRIKNLIYYCIPLALPEDKSLVQIGGAVSEKPIYSLMLIGGNMTALISRDKVLYRYCSVRELINAGRLTVAYSKLSGYASFCAQTTRKATVRNGGNRTSIGGTSRQSMVCSV